jgi:hypothetical protein
MPHPLMGLHPSEPCSSRAAVRRLRRRCPLVVAAHPCLTPHAPWPAETVQRPARSRSATGRNRLPHAPPRDPSGRSLWAPGCPASSDRSRRIPNQPAAANRSHLHSRGFRSPARARPRLQGFAPHESPLPNTGGLDRPGHVALLGLVPSRALSLTGMPRPSPQLPSWASTARSQAIDQLALQGLTSREIGLSLSRLPALLGFAAF